MGVYEEENRRDEQLYQLVMDSTKNPLSNIPDVNTRHMIMQVLAWMWCIMFSSWMGSIVVFGMLALDSRNPVGWHLYHSHSISADSDEVGANMNEC